MVHMELTSPSADLQACLEQLVKDAKPTERCVFVHLGRLKLAIPAHRQPEAPTQLTSRCLLCGQEMVSTSCSALPTAWAPVTEISCQCLGDAQGHGCRRGMDAWEAKRGIPHPWSIPSSH